MKMSVLALGLLWCHGDSFNRAELFYEFLNPPELNSHNTTVAWTHKEWPLIFDTIAEIAILTIPRAYKDFDKRRRI